MQKNYAKKSLNVTCVKRFLIFFSTFLANFCLFTENDSLIIRFGKLGKTQGKPYCNSKSMGIHFPQPIFMSIFEKKLNFFAT